MNKNSVLVSMLLVIFLLGVASCAEKNEGGDPQIRNNAIPETDSETVSETTPSLGNKEAFKQYSINDQGDYVFECTAEQQKRVNTFAGKVHTVWTATSEDGETWGEEEYIQPGSVPEVLLFKDKYYMFVMGGCLMYESEDGLTFQPYSYTLQSQNIPEDFRNFGGVDPTALVDNGKIRLFFYEPEFQGTTPIDPALVEGEHSIVQYTSDDAITWVRVGEAVAVEHITDPDIVFYNGLYYLFLSKGTSVIATSSDDGEIFSVLNNAATVHNLGGVPDTIVKDDMLYMYAHKHNGQAVAINIMTSTDGISWKAQGTALEEAESPSIVQLSDGSYRMYYVKSMSQEEYEALEQD